MTEKIKHGRLIFPDLPSVHICHLFIVSTKKRWWSTENGLNPKIDRCGSHIWQVSLAVLWNYINVIHVATCAANFSFAVVAGSRTAVGVSRSQYRCSSPSLDPQVSDIYGIYCGYAINDWGVNTPFRYTLWTFYWGLKWGYSCKMKCQWSPWCIEWCNLHLSYIMLKVCTQNITSIYMYKSFWTLQIHLIEVVINKM